MRYTDLLRIGKFAGDFGLHPDDVFASTAFGTFIEFHVAWKEEQEFDERRSDIWNDLNRTTT